MTIKSHNVFHGSASFNSRFHSGYNSFGPGLRRWRIVDKPDGFNYHDGSILVNDDFPPYSAFQLQLTGTATSYLVGKFARVRDDSVGFESPRVVAIDATHPLDAVKSLAGWSGHFVDPGTPDRDIPCTGLFTNEGMEWITKRLFHRNNTEEVVRVRLIDSVGFGSFKVTDTYDSHPGWSELVSSYQPTLEDDGIADEIWQYSSGSNPPQGVPDIEDNINGFPYQFAYLGISDMGHVAPQNQYTSFGYGVRGDPADPVPYPLFVNFRSRGPNPRGFSVTPIAPDNEPYTGHRAIQRDTWFPRFGNATWEAGVPVGVEAPPRGFFVIKGNDRVPEEEPVILFGMLLDTPFTGQIPTAEAWGIPTPKEPTGRLGYSLSFQITGLLE